MANLGCNHCALLLEVGGAETPKTHPRPLSGKLVAEWKNTQDGSALVSPG